MILFIFMSNFIFLARSASKDLRVQIITATDAPEHFKKHLKHLETSSKEKLWTANKYYKATSDIICQVVGKSLSRNKIMLVKDRADIVIIIGVQKMTQFTYAKELIVEKVLAIGYRFDKEVFSINFEQHRDYIDFRFWRTIKTPERIGTVLAKKILQRLRQLQ